MLSTLTMDMDEMEFVRFHIYLLMDTRLLFIRGPPVPAALNDNNRRY